MLLEFNDKNAHNESLVLRRSHAAQIGNDAPIEQFLIRHTAIAEQQPVDTIGHRFKSGLQRSLVIATRIGGVIGGIYIRIYFPANVRKRWVIPAEGIRGPSHIPAHLFVRTYYGFFEYRRHGGIHGPAHVEHFKDPIDMLIDMYAFGEFEGIDSQQIVSHRIGSVDLCAIREFISIFAFCRLYDQKIARTFVKQAVHGIGFSTTCGARHEHV